MKRRRKKRRNPSSAGFWPWVQEHPFLTFFLASSAIAGVVTIVTSAMRGSGPDARAAGGPPPLVPATRADDLVIASSPATTSAPGITTATFTPTP